jgi:alpha-1,2-mannosyltransferase
LNEVAPTEEKSNRPVTARLFLVAAILLWLVPMIVVGAMVFHNPLKHTVTNVYHDATQDWFAGKDMYATHVVMNYLPQFAVMFKVIDVMPMRIGDVIWRAAGVALLVFAIWRWLGLLRGQNVERLFFYASFLAMPLSLGAIRNGQANVIFGAATVYACVLLAEKKWWAAVGLMIFALALKPLAVVLILLAPVLYAPVRWRMVLALVAFALAPFLFASPSYAMSQYHGFAENMRSCAVVTEHRFADINGIFRTFNTAIPSEASKLIRVVTGALTLGLWWLFGRKLREPSRALWLCSLTTAYLMLFNPMTEANSYVIFAPVLAVWAVDLIMRRCALGWLAAFAVLSMGLLPSLLRPLFGNDFALFWHPLISTVFLALLIGHVWRQSAEQTGATLSPAAAV